MCDGAHILLVASVLIFSKIRSGGPAIAFSGICRQPFGEKLELQVCHHRLKRFVTMSGPARVTVSVGGITVESGKAVTISEETCVVPQASNFQGGVVTRGASPKQ